MGSTVPVPATTLEALADSADKERMKQAQKDLQSNVKSIRHAQTAARAAANSTTGSRFVSISESELSTLTAFGGDDWDARDTATHFLEQYGVW